MSAVETLARYFGFAPEVATEQVPLPIWKVVAYSVAIVAVFFAGTVLESRVRSTGVSEAIGAIPVLICAVLVLRLPPAAPIRVRWGWRTVLLALPFLFLFLADYSFPGFAASQASVWTIVIVQTLGIAVGEELTFRFALHRLWVTYSALFYVLGSATIFAVLHSPLGLQVSILSGVIGAAFAASRAAGMPLLFLIILHAFFDLPAVYRSSITV